MPKRQTVIAVGLGQLLSLCITGTSSASSALWRHYSISIPFTQNLCNYILLAIIYTTFSRNKPSSSTSRFSWQCEWTDYTICLWCLMMWYVVFGFSFADVLGNWRAIATIMWIQLNSMLCLGNVLAVLAFKNTSVLSALVLSSWSIPCIMLLSTYFLNATYSKIHVQSAFVCLIGLALLIWGDTIDDDEATSKSNCPFLMHPVDQAYLQRTTVGLEIWSV